VQRLFHDEPYAISQLTRLALRKQAILRTERMLGMAELSDAELQRLLTAFAAERQTNCLLVSVRGERAGFHRLFRNLQTGQLGLVDFLSTYSDVAENLSGLTLNGGAFLYSYRLAEDHAYALRQFNAMHRIALLPPWEQPIPWTTVDLALRAARDESLPNRRLLLTITLHPDLHKVGEAARRDAALLGCVQAALAAERFRLAHKRWPKDLPELVPALLPTLPVDPYSGKHLRYEVRDGGVLIYPVPRDPRNKDPHPVRPDLDYASPADLALRLWNPEKRNLPPPPSKNEPEP
jgi:hypothetical protein